jgi:MoxR-like ATPase
VAEVLDLQRVVSRLTVMDRVRDYAVRIARETRTGAASRWAPGRADRSRSCASRARRPDGGTSFVTPDDVKSIALPVLRHRLTLAPELELEGVTTDQCWRTSCRRSKHPRE